MTNKERFLSICEQQIHREGLPALMAWLEKSDFKEALHELRHFFQSESRRDRPLH